METFDEKGSSVINKTLARLNFARLLVFSFSALALPASGEVAVQSPTDVANLYFGAGIRHEPDAAARLNETLLPAYGTESLDIEEMERWTDDDKLEPFLADLTSRQPDLRAPGLALLRARKLAMRRAKCDVLKVDITTDPSAPDDELAMVAYECLLPDTAAGVEAMKRQGVSLSAPTAQNLAAATKIFDDAPLTLKTSGTINMKKTAKSKIWAAEYGMLPGYDETNAMMAPVVAIAIFAALKNDSF